MARRFREDGDGGGQIPAQGTPEKIAKKPASHTRKFFRIVADEGRDYCR